MSVTETHGAETELRAFGGYDKDVEHVGEESAMSSELRKARVKVLKRILNSLTVEINELKQRGESDIEELENARSAITKFCDKLWPFSMDSTKVRHTHYGSRDYHHNPAPMMRVA